MHLHIYGDHLISRRILRNKRRYIFHAKSAQVVILVWYIYIASAGVRIFIYKYNINPYTNGSLILTRALDHVLGRKKPLFPRSPHKKSL